MVWVVFVGSDDLQASYRIKYKTSMTQANSLTRSENQN
jgi:hypothetical protein